MRAIICEGVLGVIRYIQIYISFLAAHRCLANLQKYFLYFPISSAISCALTPEALPAGLTAVMKIYTRMELTFTKPKRSSHLFPLL